MTCQIENWLSFCGNFPRLHVYLAVAQYEDSKYLRHCPRGIWTPPCQHHPHRRFALWKLEDILVSRVSSDPGDVKSNHILHLWKLATRSRGHHATGCLLGQNRRNQTEADAPK